MQDLRLVGVADDGAHVLLADAQGARFRLPLDDALRAAVRRDRPRLGQLQIEVGGLRPREVQELIRSGLSTQEVADRSGWTVEKVHKFEVPVLAEREYVANLARAANPARDSRSSTSLEERAVERLRQRGVPLDRLAWDSARVEGGVWTVQVAFPAGGRERVAQWRFDPKARYLRALNDDARWLSEDDTHEHGMPTPHRADVADPRDQVFDVEAGEPLMPASASLEEREDDLTDAVRAHSSAGRRKRRRSPAAWSEELPIETLPLESVITEGHDVRHDGEVAIAESPEPGPGHGDVEAAAGSDAPPDTEQEPGDDAAPAGSSRRGRARVPSWDDIVFGTRVRGQG